MTIDSVMPPKRKDTVKDSETTSSSRAVSERKYEASTNGEGSQTSEGKLPGSDGCNESH